jgi:hypothetical protein
MKRLEWTALLRNRLNLLETERDGRPADDPPDRIELGTERQLGFASRSDQGSIILVVGGRKDWRQLL